MTLPYVVSCPCGNDTATDTPRLVMKVRSRVRVPGQLDANLLGYYPLGNHNGTDISGRANHATQAITPVGTTRGRLCEYAEVVDGRQHYTLPFTLDEQITASIWIRPKQVKLESTILSVGNDLRFGLSWYLEPIIWINERSQTETVISADPIVADLWHHLVFVRDGNEYRIYVNGDPIALYHEGLTASPIIAARDITPGVATISRYRGSSGLHGAIQDAVIRSTAMTGEEINAEYRSYCEKQLAVVGEPEGLYDILVSWFD